MINSQNHLTDTRALLPEVVELEVEYFEQAVRISNQVNSEPQQWQTYLNALALLSFEQWLGERVTDLALLKKNCSLSQPQYANVMEAVCNLQVGEFNLCLIASENLRDEVVNIPRVAVDLPEFKAHFYVLVEVQEEQEQAIIRGILRYDQLVNLQPQQHWSYQLPLSLFDPEPNHLLYYLRFLEPSAISVAVTGIKHPEVPYLQPAQLEALLSSLKSPNQKLWESLTWEQGVIVFQNPKLLDLLYQFPRSPELQTSLSIRITQLFTLLAQQTVNLARWLQGEVDELAQSLGLFMPQTFTLATSEFRSIDKLENAIAFLRNGGMPIPLEPSCTYQDLDLEGMLLRLYTVTWTQKKVTEERLLDTAISSPKWSLLLILGTQIGNPLSDEVKLQVSNLTGVLSEAISDEHQFIYAHVEGDWGEKYVVTIVPKDRQPLTLPAYTFAIPNTQILHQL